MNQEVKAAGVAFPKRPHIMCISIMMILLANIIKLVLLLVYPQFQITSMYWVIIVVELLSWAGLLLILARLYAGSRGWLIAMLVFVSLGVLGAMVNLIKHPAILFFQVCFIMEIVSLIAVLLLFSPSVRAWVTKIKSLGLYKKRGGVTALIIVLFVIASSVITVAIIRRVIRGVPKEQFMARIDGSLAHDFCHKVLSHQDSKKVFKAQGITKDNCVTEVTPIVKQCNVKISASMPAFINMDNARIWRKQLIACLG